MEAKQILYIITNFTDDFDNSEIFIPLFPFLSKIFCLLLCAARFGSFTIDDIPYGNISQMSIYFEVK